ncbi:BQ5605_C038g11697 [Microbotryum silenes-dioicae]|uniref:BQ5605_C038g11697 protein n=1 Tax=Microbotryum silenes-dioicae TaxID=796604 RepID=A0A2X0PA03_9BASI|nr:BQ5605_C038g11697 [Microbotryum silenes-dioicae]
MLGRAALWSRARYSFLSSSYRERLFAMIRDVDRELGEALDQMTLMFPIKLSSVEMQQTMEAIWKGFRQLSTRGSTEQMTSQ